jgi:hypothetical protein
MIADGAKPCPVRRFVEIVTARQQHDLLLFNSRFSKVEAEDFFRKRIIPELRRNEVLRFICKVHEDLREIIPSRGNYLMVNNIRLIMFYLFYRFFEASNCLDLAFKDEAGCKRLLSYDISTEYEGKTNSDFFISKTHTLLTEYLSVTLKFYNF